MQPARIVSEERTGQLKDLTLEIATGDIRFPRLHLELEDSPLAKAVAAALERDDLMALQTRWSGEAIFVALGGDFTVPDGVGEAKTSTFQLGAVGFSEKSGKFFIAYGQVGWWDNEEEDDSVCHLIGRVVDDDLETLQTLGQEMWESSRRKVTVVS